MEKIKISITVDHVFRNVYGKITSVYKKYNVELPQMEAEENETEFIAPVLNLPITSTNLMDHIPFKDIEEMNDFIFSEFPVEIFGYSKETETGSMMVFNDWLYNLPENIEVTLISNEISKTKPATLYFLSKTGFEGNNIKFIDDTIDIWENCDILITSSEQKYLKPTNKKMIIIEREHNKHLTGDMKFPTLFDFFEAKIEDIVEMEVTNNN